MKLAENVSIGTLAYAGIEPCIYWAKRGFGVRVYKNGTKTYVQSYRVSGRKRLLTVGAYPSLSREKAEDVAAAYRVQIAEGSDPVLEKRFSTSASKLGPTDRQKNRQCTL